MHHQINIRPLSVNQCWQGRRFKTKGYVLYEKEVFYLLPRSLVVPEGKLEVKIIFGLSSTLSDIDNGVKPLLDILQKKYDFNDKRIYRLIVQKKDVEKGEEFIRFEINIYADL